MPPENATQINKSYIPALTGIRAIAAWVVFLHHFNPFVAESIGWRVVRQFYVGVALFFVLSGLLICLRYLGKIEFKKHWLKKYFRNRVARIYPMYFLITCITFAVLLVRPYYDATGTWQSFQLASDKLLVFGLNLTFLRGFFDQFKFTGVAAGWTLTVEECFYALAPFLLLGLREKPLKLVLYALLLPFIGVLLVRYMPHRYGFFDSYTFLFTVTFFGRCLEFLAGMGLALFLLKQGDKASSRAIYTWLGVAWIAIVIGLMAWADNPHLPEATTLPTRIFLNNVLLVPGLCALLYGLIREPSSLRRLLETPAFGLLGKASYTFYLVHQGVLSKFFEFYVTNNIAIRFLITNVIAIALFKLVEEPLHKWITGYRKRKQVQMA